MTTEGHSTERTLAMIKPNTVRYAREIEIIIRNHGFTIVQQRLVHLTREQAMHFYSEHTDKPFFAGLVQFMSSGPVKALELARTDAVSMWRQLMGPTRVAEARRLQPTCIRARYGSEEPDSADNAVHGSDSSKSAVREIVFFFGDHLKPTVSEPVDQQEDRDSTVCTTEAIAGGGIEAREYLERYINRTLTQGLAELCRQKPQQPVIWLADWLTLR